MSHRRTHLGGRIGVAGLLLAVLAHGPSSARSLEAVQRDGLALCAHPNALPFASKKGPLPGFQVEFAEAIAARIGVPLERHWVFNAYHYRRAGCDIVLEAVADASVSAEVPLRMSRPYRRSGVVGAVRSDSTAASLMRIAPGQRVGVQVGSLASRMLAERGVEISPYGSEDEMLEALAQRQVEGVAVTQAAMGWYNATHPDAPLRMVPAFDDGAELSWNVAVGMMRPDEPLRQAIDGAVEQLLADGTVERIYMRYGAELRPPQ
jgi:polar amino acid transport system substrate-binding protein